MCCWGVSVGGVGCSPAGGRGNCAAAIPISRDSEIHPRGWAGKRVTKSARKSGLAIHPRVGEENTGQQEKDLSRLDSPPRRRGRHSPNREFVTGRVGLDPTLVCCEVVTYRCWWLTLYIIRDLMSNINLNMLRSS